MNRAAIDCFAADSWRTGNWWEREAAKAWSRSDALIIPGRNDDDIYLVRFWLSTPVRRASTHPSGEAIESGESLLLHYFARGDDDDSLHDHPWDFRTTLLSGGYIEYLPPKHWEVRCIDGGGGPAWQGNWETRCAGQTLSHRATDLHCVGSVQPDTWTLVRTGPRVREWGFHPPAQPWMGYRDFLLKGAVQDEAVAP